MALDQNPKDPTPPGIPVDRLKEAFSFTEKGSPWPWFVLLVVSAVSILVYFNTK